MWKIKPNAWFVILWLVLVASTGLYRYFNSPPTGMHQGAQADRASVAWNYFHESMNFFEPRVSENRMNEGIAGMEFPIMNYCAALCYKIFGFSDFWYRFLMFLVTTLGVFSAWLITAFFVQKTLHRAIIVFSWFLSPVFLFYSNSYIPDPAALGFGMFALYQFFRFYHHISIRKSVALYLVFISLAGLIKVTFLIIHFAVIAIWIIGIKWPNYADGKLYFRGLKWHLCMLPFVPAALWYYYAAKLTQHTGNVHFLQQINPANTLAQFADNVAFSWNTWQSSIASEYILPVIFIVFIFSAIRTQSQPLIKYLALLLLAGFMAVFILFNNQFRYHDYYYFLLYPALFFIILFLQQTHIEGRQNFFGIAQIIVIIGFFAMPLYQFSQAKTMLHARYAKGNYFNQIAFPEAHFYTKELQMDLDKIIPKNAEIISAFDASPNTSLYLLKRRGVRIANDFSPQIAADIIRGKHLKYIVINDNLRWQNQFDTALHLPKSMLYRKGLISVWEFQNH